MPASSYHQASWHLPAARCHLPACTCYMPATASLLPNEASQLQAFTRPPGICQPQGATCQLALGRQAAQKSLHPRLKKLAVVLVTCARGIYIPLRPAVPPLTAQRSFACSVASLSQYPRHYLPGHRGLHHTDPAGCHLGWDRPSTWSAAHDTVPNTPANHPPLGLQDAVTHLR